jgi:hypothetical protein
MFMKPWWWVPWRPLGGGKGLARGGVRLGFVEGVMDKLIDDPPGKFIGEDALGGAGMLPPPGDDFLHTCNPFGMLARIDSVGDF